MVCVVGRMRDLILQLSKSSIYSTKPGRGDVNDGENYHAEQTTAFGHLQLAKPASDYIGPDNQKNYQVRHGTLTVQ